MRKGGSDNVRVLCTRTGVWWKKRKEKEERGKKKHGTHAYPVRNRRIDRGRKGRGDYSSGINRDGAASLVALIIFVERM